MVIWENLALINITKAQTFYVYKLIKIVKVYKDKNIIFATILVVLPDLKSFNYNQKFIFGGFISSFV